MAKKTITKVIEVEIEFPRNLYKSPGSIPWGNAKQDKSYDTVLVKDMEEYDEEIKAGYIDSFEEALFPKKEVTKKVFGKKIELDEDF